VDKNVDKMWKKDAKIAQVLIYVAFHCGKDINKKRVANRNRLCL
jgi:hypothetical protein